MQDAGTTIEKIFGNWLTLRLRQCQCFGLLLVTLVGCGREANPWFVLSSAFSMDTDFQFAVSEAERLYDAGDVSGAEEQALRAIELNPGSQRAAVIYGYVSLAAIGLEPIALFRQLGAEEEEDSATEASGDVPQQAPSEGENEGDAGSNDLLAELQSVLSITQPELDSLGELDDPASEFPILIPKCAEEARPLVDTLGKANQAIAAICPFVFEGARIQGEPRHNCRETLVPVPGQSKVLFLWALAHLTEAIVFNAVLQPSGEQGTGGEAQNNLEKRIAALEAREVNSVEELDAFTAELNALDETLRRLLPLGDCKSTAPTTLLNATLNDLLATTAAFRSMAGLPPEFIASLSEATAAITEVGGASAGATDQLEALRNQFTAQASQDIAGKIDAITQDLDVTPEQTQEICDTLASISGQSIDASALPVICQADGLAGGADGAGGEGADGGGGLPDGLPTDLPEGVELPEALPEGL